MVDFEIVLNQPELCDLTFLIFVDLVSRSKPSRSCCLFLERSGKIYTRFPGEACFWTCFIPGSLWTACFWTYLYVWAVGRRTGKEVGCSKARRPELWGFLEFYWSQQRTGGGRWESWLLPFSVGPSLLGIMARFYLYFHEMSLWSINNISYFCSFCSIL